MKKLVSVGALMLVVLMGVVCVGCGYVYNEGDFVLTISVKETTITRGEDFVVEVQLENLSGKDVKIRYLGFPVSPRIEDWIYPLLTDTPSANLTIKKNESFHDVWYLGGGEIEEMIEQDWILKSGVHELKFRTTFSINKQSIEVWSNAVELTVI